MHIFWGRINPEKLFIYYYIPEWTISMWRLFYDLDVSITDIKMCIKRKDCLLTERYLNSLTGLFFFNCIYSDGLIIELYFQTFMLLSFGPKYETDNKIYFSSGGWSSRMVGELN